MSNVDKTKMDELLSAFVDDELSERERNEVKRLVQNDKAVAEHLRGLEKQKELLGALPIASAPQGIVQDVKGAVERKALLGKAPDSKRVRDGAKELRARRMFATAAMILIPVSILAFVVFKIVMPAPDSGNIVWVPPVVEIDGGNVPVVSYPLHACLDIGTSDSDMEAFVRKAMYKSDLKFPEEPVYEDGRTTYPIQGDRRRIVRLLGELATVWDRFDSTGLTVYGSTMSESSRVEGVTPGQAIGLYEIDLFSDPVKVAKDFDRMNRLVEILGGHGLVETAPRGSYVAMGLPMPSDPIFAYIRSREDAGDDSEVVDNATLYVTIRSR